jgi:hypothetical protein
MGCLPPLEISATLPIRNTAPIPIETGLAIAENVDAFLIDTIESIGMI